MNDRGLNDILAVVVLYRKNLATTETFTSLSRSLQRLDSRLDLLVYDNSPEAAEALETDQQWHIHYRHDPTNPGVSKAYNEGYLLARQLGKKWLLLLDQDTCFPDESLATYCDSINGQPEIAVFAPVLKADEIICSPCRYRFRTGFPLKSLAVGVHSFSGTALLNSGMLVQVAMFERCGGFDQRIRLDFADFVFNNRLRRHCESFFLLPLECRHGFSGVEKMSLAAALDRFRIFREGADRAEESLTDRLLYSLVVFKRCIRLTLQFRSLRFLAACLGSTGGMKRG